MLRLVAQRTMNIVAPKHFGEDIFTIPYKQRDRLVLNFTASLLSMRRLFFYGSVTQSGKSAGLKNQMSAVQLRLDPPLPLRLTAGYLALNQAKGVQISQWQPMRIQLSWESNGLTNHRSAVRARQSAPIAPSYNRSVPRIHIPVIPVQVWKELPFEKQKII